MRLAALLAPLFLGRLSSSPLAMLKRAGGVTLALVAPPRAMRRHFATLLLLCLPLLFSLSLAPGTVIATADPPVVPVSDAEVLHGDPTSPAIALVFNVGAGSTPATEILDTLAERHQRATFFVMGWWAERHPDVLRQIAQGGHEIASHGHSIFDLTQASDAQVRADLEAADTAISAVTGRSTRPLWSPSAGYRDARVRGIAASLGYRPILWTVDSADWTAEATAESVYSHVVNGVQNGAIVVLHFDSPTSRDTTAQVLPAMIDNLRGSGYTLLTITDLLTTPGAAPL